MLWRTSAKVPSPSMGEGWDGGVGIYRLVDPIKPSRRIAVRAAGLLFLAVVSLLLAACFSPRGGAEPPPLGGPEHSALMVSSDLAQGSNRLVFALVNRDNQPVDAQQARVTALYTPPGQTTAEARGTATAAFLPWPPEGSNRGVFVTHIDFDQAGDATRANPGLWELAISATAADGATVDTMLTAVRVAATPATAGDWQPGAPQRNPRWPGTCPTCPTSPAPTTPTRSFTNCRCIRPWTRPSPW